MREEGDILIFEQVGIALDKLGRLMKYFLDVGALESIFDGEIDKFGDLAVDLFDGIRFEL